MADYEVRRRETVVREDPVVEETVVQRDPTVQAQRQVVEDSGATGRVLVARIAALIWVLFGVLDALIALRILLKLIAANPGSGFADFVYKLTGVFLAPFSGLVASPVIGNGVFEISSIIALFVYRAAGVGDRPRVPADLHPAAHQPQRDHVSPRPVTSINRRIPSARRWLINSAVPFVTFSSYIRIFDSSTSFCAPVAVL